MRAARKRQNAPDFFAPKGDPFQSGIWRAPQATDVFTIQLFADVAGSPAVAPLLTLLVGSPGRTDTGSNTTTGSDIFAYSVDVAPIALAPGTRFWLSIFNNTSIDTNDNWFWTMQDAAGNSFIRFNVADPWQPATPGASNPGNRHDFTLIGPTAVPEPSALALVLIGAIGLLACRRKRESRGHTLTSV